MPAITLLAVGALILALVLDRARLLRGIDARLRQMQHTQNLGVEYLPEAEMVLRELRELVDDAEESITAIGGKSIASGYLKRIATRVSLKGVRYHRLLTGNHITHELHEHLRSLLGMLGVQMMWNYSEKYGSFTLSEDRVIVVLPTPHPARFQGLRLVGPHHSRLFTHVFLEACEEGIPLYSDQVLVLLCEKCSPATSRTEQELISPDISRV